MYKLTDISISSNLIGSLPWANGCFAELKQWLLLNSQTFAVVTEEEILKKLSFLIVLLSQSLYMLMQLFYLILVNSGFRIFTRLKLLIIMHFWSNHTCTLLNFNKCKNFRSYLQTILLYMSKWTNFCRQHFSTSNKCSESFAELDYVAVEQRTFLKSTSIDERILRRQYSQTLCLK